MGHSFLFMSLLLVVTSQAIPQHRLVHFSQVAVPGRDPIGQWTIMPEDADTSDETDPPSPAYRAASNYDAIQSDDYLESAHFRNSPPSTSSQFRSSSPSRTLLAHHVQALAENSHLFRGGLADYMHPYQRTILTDWLSGYFPKIFKSKKPAIPVQADMPYGYPYPPPQQYHQPAYNPYSDGYPGAYPYPPQFPHPQAYGNRRPHSPPRVNYPYAPPAGFPETNDDRSSYPYPPPRGSYPGAMAYPGPGPHHAGRPQDPVEYPIDPYTMVPAQGEMVPGLTGEGDVTGDKRKTEDRKGMLKRPVKLQ